MRWKMAEHPRILGKILFVRERQVGQTQSNRKVAQPSLREEDEGERW